MSQFENPRFLHICVSSLVEVPPIGFKEKGKQMSLKCSRPVLLVVLMSLLVSVSGAHEEAMDDATLASTLFYKQSDKLILTYEEFRGLSAEHQREWLEDLRDFYSDVDRLGLNANLPVEMDVAEVSPVEAFPWLKVAAWLPKWCAVSWTAMTAPTPAQAASGNSCQVLNYSSSASHAGGVCLVCYYTMGAGNVQTTQKVEQCSKADPYSMDPGAVANELVGNIKKANPQLGINLSNDDIKPGLQGIVSGDSNSYQVTKANPVNPTGTFKVQADPSGVKVLQVAPQEADKKISPADPMAVVQTQQDGTILKQQSNTPGAKVVETRALGDTGSLKSNDNQDVDEYMARGKLACIYAGWALQGSGKDQKGRCQAVSEKEIFNEKGDRTTYSCKKPNAKAKASSPVVYGDNNNGKNPILCNPVVFGLRDGKPICVARASAKDKGVTKKCNEASHQIDPDGKSALALATKNPSQYRELTRRVETLCVNGEKDVAGLKKIFAAKGRSPASIQASLQDLSDTCTVLQERMAVLKNANSAASRAAAGTHQ